MWKNMHSYNSYVRYKLYMRNNSMPVCFSLTHFFFILTSFQQVKFNLWIWSKFLSRTQCNFPHMWYFYFYFFEMWNLCSLSSKLVSFFFFFSTAAFTAKEGFLWPKSICSRLSHLCFINSSIPECGISVFLFLSLHYNQWEIISFIIFGFRWFLTRPLGWRRSSIKVALS